MNTKLVTILGVTASMLTTVSAVAADDTAWMKDKGWYLGANVGESTSHIDNERIAHDLMEAGSQISSMTDDGSDVGYKVYAGYQFNQHLAIEGGYFNLGEFDFSAAVLPDTLTGELEIEGINLDLVGFLPLTQRFSLLGRAGVNYAETTGQFSRTGIVPLPYTRSSEREPNPKVGVGAQYAFNDALAMRLEAERYWVDDGIGHREEADLVSLGLVYRFGHSTPTRTVAPATPAPQPAPAPQFEKYTFSATELFAFDSAELRMPQPKLDELATLLNTESDIDQIVITGHTDRLGAESYNQALSERRARAVKNYLVSRGVSADRLRAEGKGETSPVVQCDNQARSALIRCLQPNRRVEVEQITVVREAN